MQVGGEPQFCSLGFSDVVLSLFIHHPMVQLGPGPALEFGSPGGACVPQGNFPSLIWALNNQQRLMLQPGGFSSIPHTTIWAVGISQSCSCRPGAGH